MIPITRVDDYGRPRTAPERVDALAAFESEGYDREPDDAPELDDPAEVDGPREADGDREPDDPVEDDDPGEPTYRY